MKIWKEKREEEEKRKTKESERTNSAAGINWLVPQKTVIITDVILLIDSCMYQQKEGEGEEGIGGGEGENEEQEDLSMSVFFSHLRAWSQQILTNRLINLSSRL